MVRKPYSKINKLKQEALERRTKALVSHVSKLEIPDHRTLRDSENYHNMLLEEVNEIREYIRLRGDLDKARDRLVTLERMSSGRIIYFHQEVDLIRNEMDKIQMQQMEEAEELQPDHYESLAMAAGFYQ